MKAYRKLLLLIILLAMAMGGQAVTHRALIFGLGKQADPAWGKINGDLDVYYVQQLVEQMGYTDIVTLRNEEATKAAMVDAFKSLTARCQKGDYVYIHYSGHGQLITDIDGDESLKWDNSHSQWDESWVPYDAYMNYGPNDHGEKHLCDDEVALLLHNIRQKIGHKGELIVVVDACHSGDATCGEEEEPVRGVDTKFNIPRRPGTEPEPKPVEEEWRTISACKPYQLSCELRNPQVGKLTFALYQMGPKAFKKENKELEQTLRTFMEQCKGRLPQTPVVSGSK